MPLLAIAFSYVPTINYAFTCTFTYSYLALDAIQSGKGYPKSCCQFLWWRAGSLAWDAPNQPSS